MLSVRFKRLELAVIALVALCMAAAPARATEFAGLTALVEAARSAGEDAPDIARLTLVQGTSNYLLRQDGDVDFPFSVGIDLPLNAEPRPLGAALTAPIEETGRFVVVFDVALAKVSRKVRDMKDQVSRKVIAVNKIDNPAFVRAVKQLDKSSVRLERKPDNEKLLKSQSDAQIKLTTMPRYLEQPVYGAYSYRLADIEGTKSLTVNYIVFDRATNRFLKSVFDVIEHERFTVPYDMDSSDPSQSSANSDLATEKRVRVWERAPVVISLAELLQHAVAAGGPTQAVASTEALLDQIIGDRNRANARHAAEAYDDRPLNDPRFDSVVAIYTPFGMGSGFYVRSNIVMTNWHVVKAHPIVELRRYDKTETFGQVIAKDVRLDLALVKVQDRGRPVEFFQGKELRPGDAVDAIGHPQRRLFSITRGVVSAIRKGGVKTNETQNRTEAFYIQTDASINPGNSGGPLFKGDKVVGVNVASQLEASSDDNIMVPAPGMNFSVHYAEAKKFLDESMRGE